MQMHLTTAGTFGFGQVDHYWKKIDSFDQLLEL